MLNQKKKKKGNFESIGCLIRARGGEKGNYHIMAIEFQFGMMKKFWKRTVVMIEQYECT